MSEVIFMDSSEQEFLDGLRRCFLEYDGAAHSRTTERKNLEVLLMHYQTYFNRDYEGFAQTMAPNIDWEMLSSSFDHFTLRTEGREKVVEAVKKNNEGLIHRRVRVLYVVAQGDLIVATCNETGVIRATNKPYDVHFVQIFAFENDQVSKFRCVADTRGLHAAFEP